MAKAPALETIRQERAKAEQVLADIMKRERDAEEALRDAGRPVLLAALERIKIGELERADAKAIATALAKHGGAKVAAALTALKAD